MTDFRSTAPISTTKPTMAKLVFGRLSQAWKGEAADFTPLLAEQLDALGDAIGVDLSSIGETEVPTTAGRRIDIVTQVEGEGAFVVENQYGTGDHDHLTRGLAYAVAAEAKGLVVVAERHRDEFRAVAEYLNDLAEHSTERGIAVWLVEARAVRIGDSDWAPLFTAVVKPNEFTAKVEQSKRESIGSVEEFFEQCPGPVREAATEVVRRWTGAGHSRWFGPNHVVLAARGPSKNGLRAVVTLYSDGAVMVPFGAYGGLNTGIPVGALSTPEFRAEADQRLGLQGTPSQGRTPRGWLSATNVQRLMDFSDGVADAYAAALIEQPVTTSADALD